MIRKFEKILEVEKPICGLTRKFARLQHGIYESPIEKTEGVGETETEENQGGSGSRVQEEQ